MLQDVGMQERVKRVMAQTFKLDPVAVSDSLRINGIPAWNSLGHMALVVALEKEFGIRFSGSRVANLTSVSGIVKELQSVIVT